MINLGQIVCHQSNQLLSEYLMFYDGITLVSAINKDNFIWIMKYMLKLFSWVNFTLADNIPKE